MNYLHFILRSETHPVESGILICKSFCLGVIVCFKIFLSMPVTLFYFQTTGGATLQGVLPSQISPDSSHGQLPTEAGLH